MRFNFSARVEVESSFFRFGELLPMAGEVGPLEAAILLAAAAAADFFFLLRFFSFITTSVELCKLLLSSSSSEAPGVADGRGKTNGVNSVALPLAREAALPTPEEAPPTLTEGEPDTFRPVPTPEMFFASTFADDVEKASLLDEVEPPSKTSFDGTLSFGDADPGVA